MNTLTKDKKIQIDLGCGPVASSGFIGIDRFVLPGVGIAADLNKPLPIADNVVDLLFASHSLEHIDDLMFTMNEIYRVCKHGAQVCIVAPYYQQSLNFANPYHKQVFNEHTPRFWTNYHNVPIDKAEYAHAASYLWGLAESDNSTARIDMRILQMELFYYPEYQKLSVDEQRVARKKYLDVCDQIMYNLLVIKEDTKDVEMEKITRDINLYEPPYVTIRKMREESEKQLDVFRQSLAATEQKLSQTEQKLSQTEQKLSQLNFRAHNVANELAGVRQSRISRLLERFRRSDLLPLLNPAFQQLLDDSYIFQSVKGFLLQPSVNFQKLEYIRYRLKLNRPGLCGIWIAPLLDIPLQQGMIGVELVSPENKIVVQRVVSVDELREDTPGHFSFEPVLDTQQGVWEIRIFARAVEGPVRLVEWRKYSWGGLGKLKTHPFFGFDFSGS